MTGVFFELFHKMDVVRLSLLMLSLSLSQVGSKYVWNGTDWTWQQSRGLMPAVGEYRGFEGSGSRDMEDEDDDQFQREAIGFSEEEASAADQLDRAGKEIRLDNESESDEPATMSVQNQKSNGHKQMINTTCIHNIHIFFFLYFFYLT